MPNLAAVAAVKILHCHLLFEHRLHEFDSSLSAEVNVFVAVCGRSLLTSAVLL